MAGHGSRGRTLRNKREGEVRGVRPRNYRAGEQQSWLGVFVFVGGPEPIYGTTGSSYPAFTGTQAWEAPLSGIHAWDEVILVRNGASFCRDSRRFSGLGVRTMA